MLGRVLSIEQLGELLDQFITKEALDEARATWTPALNQPPPAPAPPAAAPAPALGADHKAEQRIQELIGIHGAGVRYLKIPAPKGELPQKVKFGGLVWEVLEAAVAGNKYGTYLAKLVQR